MKHSWCLNLWMSIVTGALLATFIQPVSAATPTPTPPSAEPTIPAGAITTQVGTPISGVDAEKSGEYQEKMLNLNLKIEGTLGKDLSIPDLTNNYTQEHPGLLGTLPRLQFASQALTNKYVLDNTIYNPNPMQYSGAFIICPADSAGQVKQNETGNFISGDNEQLKNVYNASLLVGPALGPGVSVPLDQTRPPIVLGPADCSIPQGSGTEMPPAAPVPVTGGIFGRLLELFRRLLINNVWNKTSDTMKATAKGKVLGNGDDISLPALTGKKDGLTFSESLPNSNFVKDSKGALTAFIPGGTTLPKNGNGQIKQTGTKVEDKEIAFNYPNYQDLVAMDTNAVCGFTQKGDPNRPSASDCNLQTSSTGACASKTLPELSGSSCKLCHPEKISSFADMQATVPDGMPPLLQQILEKAGETYNVPPASILAVMKHEGAFNRTWFTGDNAWTDANVKKWSICGGTVPISNGVLCDPSTVSYAVCGPGGSGSDACGTSIAGFGLLPYWFWKKNWVAVQAVDPSRTREIISPCNVLDAAFAVAQALSEGSVQIPPAVTTPDCFGILLNNHSIPASCTAWDDTSVFQSHVSDAGYCPQTGRSGSYPPNDSYKSMVLGVYHAFSCGN